MRLLDSDDQDTSLFEVVVSIFCNRFLPRPECSLSRNDLSPLCIQRATGVAKLPAVVEYIKDLMESGEKFLVFG